jgi:glycosyltransferase involved in cell wall biosynthesis
VVSAAERAPVTAIVLARDCEADLDACLPRLRFARELLVVDDRSRDGSRQVAARHGARVLERPLARFDEQRNFAQAAARTDWVLFVDSDERVPEALAREIGERVAAPASHAAFSIPRRNHFLGRPMRGGGWSRDRVVRLLRRDAARWEGAVHERPRVSGEVGSLTSPLEHHPYPTLSAYWDKLERYARLKSDQDHARGRRAGAWRLLSRPPASFLRMYLLRGGLADGIHGLVLAGMSSFSDFTRWVRLWERGLAERAPSGPPAPITAPSRGGPPLSVVIPAFNEEANLEAALDSAAWADEILVVDSFSTDRTVAIARGRGARVLIHEYVNSATQKNWALPRTAHRWAMILDADERFTPPLAEEVRRVLASGPPAAGYVVRRTNHFLGRRIRHCGWDRDRVLRLFDRDRGRYQGVEVHAEVEVEGEVRELRYPLLHFTYRSVDQYWPKFRRYTDWGASQAYGDGKRAGLYHLAGHPLGRFVKMYVLRLGFLDGAHGLVISLLSLYSVFNKYAKLWEMARAGAPRPAARRAG